MKKVAIVFLLFALPMPLCLAMEASSLEQESNFPRLLELAAYVVIKGVDGSQFHHMPEELIEYLQYIARYHKKNHKSLLHEAESATELNNLLRLGANPNGLSEDGETALVSLLKQGKVELAKKLIEILKKKHLNFSKCTKDIDGNSLKTLAKKINDEELNQLLYPNKKEPVKNNNRSRNFLSSKLPIKYFSKVKRILPGSKTKAVLVPKKHSYDELGPLGVAILTNDVALMKSLFRSGVDLSATINYHGRIYLPHEFAIYCYKIYKDEQVIDLFFPQSIEETENKTNISDWFDDEQLSLIGFAAAYNPKLLTILLPTDKKLADIRNRAGMNVLMYAIVKENMSIIKALLKLEDGDDLINSYDRQGNPVLMYAIDHYPRAVKLLNTGVNLADNNGVTPLMYAVDKIDEISLESIKTIISALKDAGADINAVDADGRTAFMRLLKKQDHKVDEIDALAVELSKFNNINLEIKDREGRDINWYNETYQGSMELRHTLLRLHRKIKKDSKKINN